MKNNLTSLQIYTLKLRSKADSGCFLKIKKAYFYIYDKVYVSEKLLKSPKEKSFTKKETAEFKKIYCYLTIMESHNKNKANLYFNIAEKLWKQ